MVLKGSILLAFIYLFPLIQCYNESDKALPAFIVNTPSLESDAKSLPKNEVASNRSKTIIKKSVEKNGEDWEEEQDWEPILAYQNEGQPDAYGYDETHGYEYDLKHNDPHNGDDEKTTDWNQKASPEIKSYKSVETKSWNPKSELPPNENIEPEPHTTYHIHNDHWENDQKEFTDKNKDQSLSFPSSKSKQSQHGNYNSNYKSEPKIKSSWKKPTYDVVENDLKFWKYLLDIDATREPYLSRFLKFYYELNQDIKEYTLNKNEQPDFCPHWCPPFKIVCRNYFYEVRFYQEILAVSAQYSGQDYAMGLHVSYQRPFYKYFNGENDQNKTMELTVPLWAHPSESDGNDNFMQNVVSEGGQSLTMYVFLNPKYGKHPPEPLDKRLKIVKVPARKIYVRMYSGPYGPEVFVAKGKEFLNILRMNNQKLSNSFRFSLYNIYEKERGQFLGFHNELWVPVNKWQHKPFC